jgi:tight adherence protein C
MFAEGMMALLSVVTLTAGGLTLILLAFDQGGKSVADRIDLLQGSPASRGKPEAAKRRPAAERRIKPEGSGDLTEAEHRQIVRFFAKFGVAPESALGWFKAVRILCPIVLAISMLAGSTLLIAKPLPMRLMLAAIMGIVGWFLPMILVRRAIRNHSKAVAHGLPDALELLAVCIEAGLSLENGLQRVSGELKRSLPQLADELALTWAEINILPNRDQALLNFAERVDVPSVRSVVTTLSQTLRYGTPLARSLRVVAADVRSDQLTQMEEKANRLPALMTVPVMLFIMPTIFLIIGGPAALKLMDIMWGK